MKYSAYKNFMTKALDGGDDIERWITTENNVHIPLREGQSKKDAIKSFFGDKDKKTQVVYERGKDLDSDIILAKVNGVDVGSIDVKYVDGKPNVRNIYVDPDHRKAGIASELVRQAEKQHGNLIVVPTTEEGKALWTKMGYSQNPDSKYWYKK